jgi:ABC-2 type transport system permease protein
LPKPLVDALVVLRIESLQLQRRLVLYLVVMLLFPLGVLFFARYLLPEGVDVGPRLIAGSIVFNLGITVVNSLSQSIAWARFNHQLKLFQVRPLSRGAYAAGVTSFWVLLAVVNACLILLFAPLFGIDIQLSLWFLPLALLTALSMTGLALLIGTWAPSMQTGNLLSNVVGILLVMVSPIYFPLSRLPEWLQYPARLSPYKYAADAFDAILSGASGFYDEVAVLAAIAAAGLLLGVRGMRWREV